MEYFPDFCLACPKKAFIKGLEEPQGVYYDFKTGRLYVATGEDGKLRIYDEKSLTVQETLGFGGDADNVRYEAEGDVAAFSAVL
jgi:DNA-binding beta-propeller fold protein YncE